MNSFKVFTLLAFVLVLFSCKDDAVTCEFSTANLSGQIEGVAWEFQAGTATIGSDNTMSIDLFGTDEDLTGGACSIFIGSTDSAFGTLPATVGEYTLNLDFGGSDNRTITLYDAETSLNVIVSEGCVSIDAISVDAVEISFNIKSDDNNLLRGMATLEIC